MANHDPHQSFGSIEATNAIAGNRFSGTTHFVFNQTSAGHVQERLAEKDACFHSLAFGDIHARQNDINPPQSGTCNWLFGTREFQQWQNNDDRGVHYGVLWIKRKPGAGKSTLMKHALGRYQNDLFRNHLIVAHFFNARGGTLERTTLGLLRSIVYQLLRNDSALYDRFIPIFRERQRLCHTTEWQWRLSELQDFVRSIVQQPQSRPILLLVDALDECDDVEVRNMVHFLETLSREAFRADIQLQMCLSSRHYPNIRMDKFVELPVEDNADHGKDIARYTREWLRVHNEEMEFRIVEKANHVFLWVIIVVSLLNKAYDEGRIESMKRILEEIPDDLKKLFSNILGDDTDERAETVLMLQWVLLSREELTARQLFAAAVKISLPSEPTLELIKRRITTSSKGLIEVRKNEQGTVQFIHLSVRDFLFRKKILQKLDPTLGEEPIMASHGRLWDYCWQCLEQEVTAPAKTQGVVQPLRKIPLLGYATRHILFHAEMAMPGDMKNRDGDDERGRKEGCVRSCDIPAKASIQRWVQRPNGWFQRWKLLWNEQNSGISYRVGEDAGLVYMLAFLGLRNLLAIVVNGANVNEPGGYHGSALNAACGGRHQQIVELLLKQGADVNAQGGQYGNTLQTACIRGYQQIVELLLKQGADVNAQGGDYANALQAACFRGHPQIVGLLLEQGANVNEPGGYHGSALNAACFCGYPQIVGLLLKQGADVN
ncbi:hypothetical protein MCOR25_010838, partial [Pyricularia grisea]